MITLGFVPRHIITYYLLLITSYLFYLCTAAERTRLSVSGVICR